MAYENKECRLVLEQCFSLAVKLDKVCTFLFYSHLKRLWQVKTKDAGCEWCVNCDTSGCKLQSTFKRNLKKKISVNLWWIRNQCFCPSMTSYHGWAVFFSHRHPFFSTRKIEHSLIHPSGCSQEFSLVGYSQLLYVLKEMTGSLLGQWRSVWTATLLRS